ncbi:hypothetical protein C8J56DRAFT_786987, partial [Mycena floridula]
IRAIGPEQFAGIVTDSTGNTKGSRTGAVEEFPTFLEFPDISHHTNCLIKDVVKIPHFAPTIKISRGTITFFTKSHIAISELGKAREVHHIGRGLEIIGATRFGTIIHSLRSLKRCIPALTQTIIWGRDFPDCFQSQEAPSQATFSFQFALNQLIAIGLPAAKALACLEANETTLADVYLFWHAFIAQMVDILQEKRYQFPPGVIERIYAIIEHRYAQIFDRGNLSTYAYMSAAFLNPGMSVASFNDVCQVDFISRSHAL